MVNIVYCSNANESASVDALITVHECLNKPCIVSRPVAHNVVEGAPKGSAYGSGSYGLNLDEKISSRIIVQATNLSSQLSRIGSKNDIVVL